MTIKLEQETILRVLEHPPQLQRRSLDQQQQGDEPPLAASLNDGLGFVEFRKPLGRVENLPGLTEDDDTLSTASISSDDDTVETLDRRVRFCDEVVTEVWTRPFTEKDDIPNLYYSSEDTTRFRQEYRLEKKVLSELSIDPETCSVDEKDLSAMVATSPSSGAYRISRVVVLHNDKLETFVDQNKEADMDGFFDNDSFWSGSITWY